MRTCLKCGKSKELDHFSRNKSRKDGLQVNCKSCAASIAKEWYKENKHKPEVAKRIKECNQKLIAEIKAEVDDYKSKAGCLYCQEKEPCCLDFHHLNGEEKEKNVSYLRSVKNKERLYAEIKNVS
jgi:hypothetical protein